MSSAIAYNGNQSVTLKLVLLCFATGTALLICDKISGAEWVTGVLGLMASYVLKDSVKAGAEAYRDKVK